MLNILKLIYFHLVLNFHQIRLNAPFDGLCNTLSNMKLLILKVYYIIFLDICVVVVVDSDEYKL